MYEENLSLAPRTVAGHSTAFALILTMTALPFTNAWSFPLVVGTGVLVFAGSLWRVARVPISIDSGTLRVRDARLDVRHVREVTALDEAGMRWWAGPGVDARAKLVLRGARRGGVKIDLTASVGGSYWLLTSARPHSLVAAIEAARTDAAQGAAPHIRAHIGTSASRKVSLPVLVGIAGVVVAAGAWAVSMAWDIAFPAVHSQLVTYDVTNPRSANVALNVSMPRADRADCVVRAIAADKSRVGDYHFTVTSAGRYELEVPIERPATTVEMVGCVAEGQRWRR